MQVRNNGHLTSSFSIHMANEKELELEAWCSEDDPSEETNKIISILEELKNFTFEPRSAVLQPGESVAIKLSYSFTSLKYGGFHSIPVFLKVDQGKQVYLDLIGQTLALVGSKRSERRSKGKC